MTTDSYTDLIRARLLTGESCTASQVQEDMGCSYGMLGFVIKQMRKQGYRFGESRVPDRPLAVAYTMTHNPDDARDNARGGLIPTEPKAATIARGGLPASSLPPSPTSPPTRTPSASLNGHYTPLSAPWLPDLGSVVQVTLLALDATGTVRMGLQGVEGSCLLVLESAAGTRTGANRESVPLL